MIGVSTDTQATNDRFKASLELPFEVVGDPRGRIAAGYGVRWPLVGLARRVTFVIGTDRRVTDVFKSELSPEAHVSHVCGLLARPEA